MHGAKVIASVLKVVNKTITEINLSHNKISNDGAEAIAFALEVSDTIKVIYLCDVGYARKGGTICVNSSECSTTR